MKIAKKQLRHIIREALTLSEQKMLDIVVNEYEDVEDINILANYALRDDMQGALKDKELQYYIDKNEAAMLVDDSMGWLKHVGDERYGMPAPEGWDLDKIYTFFSKFEDKAYSVYSKKAKEASAAGPNRAERKAIGSAFTYDDVSEDEIASITFQLRRRGGKVVNINMEDHDHQLGNMTTGMSEEEAKRLGTTLDKIEKTLRDGGAKERKKKKPVRRSTPYYD